MPNLYKTIAAALIIACATVLVRSQGGLVANAGPDQTNAVVGATVSLNGSGSTGASSYSWSFLSRPKGSSAALSGQTTVAPSFTPDRGGTYVVRLTVGNGVTTASDTVSVVTVNHAPEADAGPDLAGAVGKAVTLDGTGSFDPDNDTLVYAWTVVNAPPASVQRLTNTAKSKAKLLIDRAGTYVVQLVVRDGKLTSVADQAIVTTTNSAPVARAGADRVVTPASPAQLDGTASSDVDGDALTYTWKLKRPSGSRAVLSDASSPRPVFTPDLAGLYTATLTVSDGVLKKTDSVILTPGANLPPVARAGRDYPALLAGQSVLLDGSSSTDANGDRLGYAWSVVKRPQGSTAALSAPQLVRTAFTADVKGNYTFRLVVTDGSGASSFDDVVYAVAPPQADAGPDHHANPGAVVTLDGSGSSHLSGLLRYGWSLVSVPDGSEAALSDPTDPQPKITVDLPGLYVAQLIVFDGAVLSPADVAVVTVSENSAPRVELGPDRVVPLNTVVTLDGGAATDDDPGALTLRWSLLARPPASAASVSSTNGASTQITIDRNGTYVAQLIATDQGGLSTTDTVVIATSQGRPSVSVGPDRAGTPNEPLALAAIASDPDGGGLTFAWRLLLQPEDSAAVFSSPTGAATNLVPDVAGDYVAQLIARDDDRLDAIDTLVIRVTTGERPVVTIAATDASASEAGSDPGTFTVTRTGDVSAPLNGVGYTRTGTATAGADFTPSLPASGTVDFAAGQATATITITPVDDDASESAETVVLTLVAGATYELGAPASQSATVTIADNDTEGGLTNGGMHFGAISAAGQVNTLTFNATSGERIAVHIGEIVDNNDFRPWIRLLAPSSAILGSTSNVAAAAIEAVAPASGTYTVLVASADAGNDGTGTYRLTAAHTQPPHVVFAGDQGGALTNGTAQVGEVLTGDVDVWTFTAATNDRIAVHLAELTDANGFQPWVRVWAPTGAWLADASGTAAIVREVVAPANGTYLVLVASADSGLDATGTYRLEMVKTPAPVFPGDDGGALTNGTATTGSISVGDVDVWTFTAATNDRIAVHLAELTDANGFQPWVRVWAPTGAWLADASGSAAIVREVVAPVTGTYLVLVASADSGTDATGTYRLEMVKTPAPVFPGDDGGALTNGTATTGTITVGDVDVWTFTATTNDRVAVHLAELTDNSGFQPWVRVWAPTGAWLADASGSAAIVREVVAPVTGTYLVLVASADSGTDATGTYRLEMVKTPAPVFPGDDGGALTNGSAVTGTTTAGDVDVWTFTATANNRIAVHLAELTDGSGFQPWVRVWAPTGAWLADASGSAAIVREVVAPVTGTYLVLVASADAGTDATGTYRLEMVKTPAPVFPGDDGGALTNGGAVTGTTTAGDVDVWTFTATANDRVAVHLAELTDGSGFQPWVRVWSPTGAWLADASGNAAIVREVVAPVTGTYLVLVASADAGTDATGTYRLEMVKTPAPVFPTDDGGALTNGGVSEGTITAGDVDVWTITATAGNRIAVRLTESTDGSDFQPWVRVWAPTGAWLADAAGAVTVERNVVAPVTGTYLVLVASADAGTDATGTYTVSASVGP